MIGSRQAMIDFILAGMPQSDKQEIPMRDQAAELIPFAKKLGLREIEEFLSNVVKNGKWEDDE